MPAERKKKRLSYFRARFLNEGPSLQELLTQALHQKKIARERMEDISPQSTDLTHRFINVWRPTDNMLFGDFVAFAAGTNRHLLTLAEDQEEMPVEQMAPGSKKEFLDAAMYFGVQGNHVVLLQAQALKYRQFENHLNWLLLDQCELLDENRVQLVNHTPTANREQLRRARISNITLRRPLVSGGTPAEGVAVTKIDLGSGVDMIKAAFSSLGSPLPELDAISAESDVDITLVVRAKSRGQRNPEAVQAFMLSLAQAVSEEDDEATINLSDESKIQGGDLYLRRGIQVECFGGLVAAHDLFPLMYDWLQELIERQEVDP